MNPRPTKIGYYVVKLYKLGYLLYQVKFDGTNFINVDGTVYGFADIEYFYEE